MIPGKAIQGNFRQGNSKSGSFMECQAGKSRQCNFRHFQASQFHARHIQAKQFQEITENKIPKKNFMQFHERKLQTTQLQPLPGKKIRVEKLPENSS